MNKNILLTLIVISGGALYYLEAQENSSLKSKILELEVKLSQKQVADNAIQKVVHEQVAQTDQDSQVSTKPQIAAPEAAKKNNQATHRQERDQSLAIGGQIFAERQIEAVDQTLSLTDTEKAGLKDHLALLFKSDEYQFSTDEGKDAQLKDALIAEVGDERADLYLGVKRDVEMKADNDSRELAASMFSKRLNLSPDQATQLSGILQEVDGRIGSPTKMLKQKMQELHSPAENGNQDPAQMMKQYVNMAKAIRDTRRSALNERLQGVLTKEQYNTLISEQAASPEALWGLRGY
jgi:hypothetical protein